MIKKDNEGVEDEEENNSEYCYNNRGHMPCMVCNGYYRLYPL